MALNQSSIPPRDNTQPELICGFPSTIIDVGELDRAAMPQPAVKVALPLIVIAPLESSSVARRQLVKLAPSV